MRYSPLFDRRPPPPPALMAASPPKKEWLLLPCLPDSSDQPPPITTAAPRPTTSASPSNHHGRCAPNHYHRRATQPPANRLSPTSGLASRPRSCPPRLRQGLHPAVLPDLARQSSQVTLCSPSHWVGCGLVLRTRPYHGLTALMGMELLTEAIVVAAIDGSISGVRPLWDPGDPGGDMAVLGAGEDHAEAPGRGCGWRGGDVRPGVVRGRAGWEKTTGPFFLINFFRESIGLTSRVHIHLSKWHFVFATSFRQVGPTCQKSCQFIFRPSFARIAKNHLWSGRFTFRKHKVVIFHKFSLKSSSFMLFTYSTTSTT
jgi:hypothetical protein